MKVKVSEATLLQLDMLVAKCEYPKLEWGETIGLHRASRQVVIPDFLAPRCYFHPSSNWSQGGPILEREKITTVIFRSDDWISEIWERERGRRLARGTGPTLLVAAMRCYVASKLGDEVEVPEELE